MTKLSSEAVEAWAAARADDDYASFRPWLDRTLELKHATSRASRRRTTRTTRSSTTSSAACGPTRCAGCSTGSSRRSASSSRRPAAEEDEPFLTGPYPERAQHELSVVVTRAFGAADEFFRLDPTVHPFCIVVLDAGRPADDALRGGRPARRPRSSRRCTRRARPLRARRRPVARPHAARDGLLVRAPRVAEPALGERHRPLAGVLALVLPAVPRRRSHVLDDVPLETLPSRDQPARGPR